MMAMEGISVERLCSVSKNMIMSEGYNDASIEELRRRIYVRAETQVIRSPSCMKELSQICTNCQGIVKKDLSVRRHDCPYFQCESNTGM